MESVEQSHLHLRYAIQKGTENHLRFVDDVPRGLECNCVCPYCKVDLMAKQGQKKEHHFAHKNNKNCTGARMTALHMLAQNVLAETKQVMLPEYNGNYYKHCAELKTFERVEKEQVCRNEDSMRRPDCIGYNDTKGGNIWIEIYCRHKIDETKKAEIRAQQQYCIEIDFSDWLKTNYSEEDVKNRLLEISHREWICCPNFDRIEERKRQEEERKKALEKEYQLQQEMILKQYRKDVLSWYEDGDSRKADAIIREIKNMPYRDDVKIYDVLVPHNNFLEFIDESPKNETGLSVFYTLLWYYYPKVRQTNYQTIKQNLKLHQYSIDQQTKEDKIKLEELISLRIIYILELNRKKYLEVDPEEIYKTCIKKYLSIPEIRNEILMLVSVLYHHIIGSAAQNFGALTQEIIQNHPDIAKIYVMVIDSQDKFPNDYTLNGRDMISELRQYVAENDCNANEYVDNIMQECYGFVYEKKNVKKYESKAIITPIDNFSQIPNQYAWDQINKWYQES